MSELRVIESLLERTARRRRLERALGGVWLGLLAGSSVWLAVLALQKLVPLPNALLAAAGLSLPAGMILGALLAGRRKPGLFETARWVDCRQQLKERLGTALEASAAPGTPGQWGELVVRDAAARARNLDPRQMLPLHLTRHARHAALLLLLAAGLGFVPEYRGKERLQRQNEAANIQDAGRQLASLTRRTLAAQPHALEETRKALERVAETGERLAQGALARDEALRALAAAAKPLAEQARAAAKNPALMAAGKAAQEGSQRAGQSPGDMQKQLDTLQQSGKPSPSPAALDKLRDKLNNARQSAASLPNSAGASSAAAAALAENLSKMASDARDQGTPLEGLEQALAALEKGQIGAVAQDLDAALQDLDKARETAQTLQKLQQQAAQTGRDLAEQLASGQVDAARNSLEKLSRQLTQQGLSQEQRQKILDEVSKAVDPADPYGKVKDLLKQASSQLAKKSDSESSKSLAEAARELEKMQDQMNDVQSMAASLDALDRAQQAVASGKSWSQCKNGQCKACMGLGCAECKGRGWKPGGKPGAGVGTWADEEGWSQTPEQRAVDNSGVVRPDMAGRAPADRAETEVTPDRFAPSKVRGRLSPGGTMPSITLKGVAVKGTSTAEFQQAAAAAQAEARSALNQDQVPRAYQNAVKDYFDDLKP